ncbi:MAG TPA: peptidylprolyl isomerase [Rhodocyclaceae bacterium]|nr:peptidylprolyl isomerase [Rhodocyclaceae bacterium]
MISGQFVRRLRPLCLVTPLLLIPVALTAAAEEPVRPAAAAEAAAAPAHSDVFATVNGQAISIGEYESAFANLVRQKFYHGQVPEAQLQAARDETKNKLVQRIVLLEEAGRRGIVPDEKAVEEAIAGYERQYAASPVWRERRESLLPGLRKQLGEQNQLSRLEQEVRQLPEPTDAEVRAFYDQKPELFTEPEKLRMSAILLAVDPSSPASTWQGARDEAAAIYKRLQAGGNFEEAARLHSNGKFADDGGNMGYLHRGMMPEALQERVDSFEVGKVNAPIDSLEGVVIFRLDERVPPKKREFADVAQRAKELLARDRQEQAWKGLLDKLTGAADVKVQHQLGTGSREGKGS